MLTLKCFSKMAKRELRRCKTFKCSEMLLEDGEAGKWQDLQVHDTTVLAC